MKIFAVTILFLGLLGATGTWLALPPSDASAGARPERVALPVRVAVLEPVTSIIRERQLTGVVAAARRTMLAFERSARLNTVMVDEGQSVQAGQVLAVLDQRQLDAQVNEVDAGIQQQKAVLAELIKGPRQELIAATEAERAALAADVELRKATLDRTQSLHERQATSAQALDEVRLAWKAAVASRDAVTKRLDELRAGTRKEQLAAQEAVVIGLKAKAAAVAG
ncbi:MAG: biotin/lipoyl-binding protein [Planctomycetaceae bacterium]